MDATLANVEYRTLWFAEAQSSAGDQLAKVALAILVYGRTNSALWAAIVYALTFLPALAGGLRLAPLADRHAAGGPLRVGRRCPAGRSARERGAKRHHP